MQDGPQRRLPVIGMILVPMLADRPGLVGFPDHDGDFRMGFQRKEKRQPAPPGDAAFRVRAFESAESPPFRLNFAEKCFQRLWRFGQKLPRNNNDKPKFEIRFAKSRMKLQGIQS